MKRMKLLTYLLTVAALYVSVIDGYSRSKEKEYDVYILIGQSNMAGRGEMEAEDYGVMEGIWLLDDKGKPVPAENPLNKFSTVRKGYRMQKIGPGYSFAKEIHERTGRKVLLVVNALGGSTIGQWKKSAGFIQDKESIGYNERKLYEEALYRARKARKYGTIKAVLWHQGEGNASPKLVPYYMKDLQRFVEDFRTDMKMMELPFIAGQIGAWREDFSSFNRMLSTIGNYIPFSACISSEGCGHNPDRLHFSRDGQILLGHRYAEAVIRLCY